MLEQVCDRPQSQRLGGTACLAPAQNERLREPCGLRVANRSRLELGSLELP
jgi:hypothetical protein